MLYIYILLTIIAIGVLLASEGGQALLVFLLGLAAIGALLYFGFWVCIIAIEALKGFTFFGFLNSRAIETIFNVIVLLFWIGLLWFIIYYSVKTIKKEGFKKFILSIAKIAMNQLIMVFKIFLGLSLFIVIVYYVIHYFFGRG